MKRLIVFAGANGAGKSSLRAGGADQVEHGQVLYEAPDLPLWLTWQMPRIVAELERVAQQSRPTPRLSSE